MELVRTLGAGLVLMIAALAQAWAGPTLDGVKSKGYVACAVNTGLAGFSMADQQGHFTGLDVDVCRAVAAAVLGDATKTKFVPATAAAALRPAAIGRGRRPHAQHDLDPAARHRIGPYLRAGQLL